MKTLNTSALMFLDMSRYVWGQNHRGFMPKGKISQIKAILLVAVLELEKLEKVEPAKPSRRHEKKPPHIQLILIKGGKG